MCWKRNILPGLTGLLIMVLLSSLKGQFLPEDDGKIDILFSEEKLKQRREYREKRYPQWLAYNIEARKSDELPSTVIITWEADQEFRGEFVVGRLNEIASTPDRALAASAVRIVPSRMRNVVVDGPLPAGRWYYVVISKRKLFQREIELYRGMNYTLKPVVITTRDVRERPLHVTEIRIRGSRGKGVRVEWNPVSDRGVGYALYRSKSVLEDPGAVRRAERVAMITGRSYHIDRPPEDGAWYYAVLVVKDGRQVPFLAPDENYTTSPHVVGQAVVKDEYRVMRLVGARDGENVILKWVYAGRRGDETAVIFRVAERPCRPEEIRPDQILARIPVTKREYLAEKAPAGRRWYGVLTRADTGKGCVLERGRNLVVVDSVPETPSSARDTINLQELLREEAARTGNGPGENVKPEKKKGQDTGAIPTKSGKSGDRDTINRKKEERTTIFFDRENIPGEERVPSRRSQDFGSEPQERDLEKVVRRTFYRGKYEEALAALKEIARYSDNNKEVARSRLFMGRCHIEMKNYRKALEVLADPLIKEEYPREWKFWRDYAARRLE